MGKTLIAFYSRTDENYVNGQIKTLTVGNTELVAGMLQKLTGADMFKIEQKQPYSKDYNECIEQARADQNQNARPELVSYPEVSRNTAPFILDFQTIGVQCRWQYLHFWSILTLAGKP